MYLSCCEANSSVVIVSLLAKSANLGWQFLIVYLVYIYIYAFIRCFYTKHLQNIFLDWFTHEYYLVHNYGLWFNIFIW